MNLLPQKMDCMYVSGASLERLGTGEVLVSRAERMNLWMAMVVIRSSDSRVALWRLTCHYTISYFLCSGVLKCLVKKTF